MLWMALLAAAGLAVACGDDPPAGQSQVQEDTGPGEDTGPDVGEDTTPDAGSQARLILLSEPEPSVSFSEEVPIRVLYVDADENPVPDTFIAFTPQGDTADSGLSSQNSATNADGEAEVMIDAGVEEVDFEVIISVFEDDSVEPLTVTVYIQPKGDADYLIRVTYDGPLSLHHVEVLVYDTAGGCAGLTESPTEAPSEDSAWTTLPPIYPSATGELPDRGLNVPTSVALTYAVARAVALDGEGDEQEYFTTFGCADGIPAPDVTEATVIEIPLHHMWPSMAGTYTITQRLNLIDFVPDEYQGIVEAVGAFFDRPGVGLLQLIALAQAGDAYYDESPWEILFSLCTEPGEPELSCENAGDVVPTTIGIAAGAIVEGLLRTALAAANMDVVFDILDRASDIYNTAQEFQLEGELVIGKDPDGTGVLEGPNSIAFTELHWYWDGGDSSVTMENGEWFSLQCARLRGRRHVPPHRRRSLRHRDRALLAGVQLRRADQPPRRSCV
jgi:hypothetical protein